MSVADLRRLAEQWMIGDPDETTRTELGDLLASGRTEELRERFAQPMQFGTAGLRGLLGAGPSRMNRAVVIRTSHGLARYALDHLADAGMRGAVVGCDARRMSRELADEAAAVFAAAGIVVHRFDDVVPTPLVSFAVAHLGAAFGVMITASHNPAEYNGYKVYWAGGGQIVSPIDEGIARAIELSPAAALVPRDARSSRIHLCERSVRDAYLDGVRGLAPTHSRRDKLRIVYTPLHGVGYEVARSAMAAAGFAELIPVPGQVDPDPAFPTVSFPNPEERGVLDRALGLAAKEDADLVLAHDPDADRLAVAARADDGRFVQLTGNEVGVLLGHYLLTESAGSDKAVVSTIVSSPMLGEIASRLGATYEETLTGFKWIVAGAIKLERAGKRFIFGYEEAIGYSVGTLVRDKDGIGAGVVVAELAARLSEQGSSLFGELEALYRRFGLYASLQRSVTLQGAGGAARIAAHMVELRRHPPDQLGGRPVLEWRDYAARRAVLRSGKERALSLPASDVLAFDLEGGSRVVVRPSGTEPKIKCYVDHREQVAVDEPVASARARAERAMQPLFLLPSSATSR